MLLRCLLSCLCLVLPSMAQGPVRVFLLAGQSNMEGKGAVRHLEALVKEEEGRARLASFLKGGRFEARRDVWVSYERMRGGRKEGGLEPGFGSRDHQIGPELGFGRVVGDAYEDPVLLVKCAWGGASLAEDFLPPSMGGPGPRYTEMIRTVQALPRAFAERVPGARGRRFELEGFVWFQGWNDHIGQGNPAYTEQLVALIDDLRRELKAPDLPVVIGELGQAGPEPENRKVRVFRAQQRAVAENPRLRRTVRLVETSGFISPRHLELSALRERCRGAARRAEGKEAKAAAWAPWREHETEWNAMAADGGYHYYGSGAIFLSIGEAMGEAMLALTRPRRRR